MDSALFPVLLARPGLESLLEAPALLVIVAELDAEFLIEPDIKSYGGEKKNQVILLHSTFVVRDIRVFIQHFATRGTCRSRRTRLCLFRFRLKLDWCGTRMCFSSTTSV